jgi:hypothetical protein
MQQRIQMLEIWLGISANWLSFGEDSEKRPSDILFGGICVAEGLYSKHAGTLFLLAIRL